MQTSSPNRPSVLGANAIYAFFATTLLLVSLLYAVLIKGESFYPYMLYAGTVELFLLGLPTLWLLLRENSLAYARLTAPRLSTILLIPLSVGAGTLFIGCITLLWTMLMLHLGADITSVPSIPIPQDALQLITELIVVALIPGLCEEFLFRGAMLPAYERLGSVRAILLSGALFALMHGQVLAMPGHLILGFVLGALFVLTRTFWVPMIYHILHNALTIVVQYTQRFSPSTTTNADTIEMLGQLGSMGILVICMILSVMAALYGSSLIAIWKTSKHNDPLPTAETKSLHLLDFWPLVIGLCVSLFRYIANIQTLFGGA